MDALELRPDAGQLRVRFRAQLTWRVLRTPAERTLELLCVESYTTSVAGETFGHAIRQSSCANNECRGTNQALRYSLVRTNSLCPKVSAAVIRPFRVRIIMAMSASPA